MTGKRQPRTYTHTHAHKAIVKREENGTRTNLARQSRQEGLRVSNTNLLILKCSGSGGGGRVREGEWGKRVPRALKVVRECSWVWSKANMGGGKHGCGGHVRTIAPIGTHRMVACAIRYRSVASK